MTKQNPHYNIQNWSGKMKPLYVCLIALALLITFGLRLSGQSQTQTTTKDYQEFVQLLPYGVLNPGDERVVKVGTVGTNELQPCLGVAKVWKFGQANLKLDNYCRIDQNGYAYLYFKNEGTETIALYDRVRVVVF